MASTKLIATPEGALKYINIVGKGKENYDQDGYEYTGSVILSKKEAKNLYKDVIVPFFEENKPAGFKGDEPMNKILRELDDGTVMLSFKTNTTFEDEDGHVKKTKIKLINGKKQERELPDGVGIGDGSRGAISGTMSVYGNNKKAGVSLWLKTVQMTKFVKYDGNDGLEEVDSDFEDFDSEEFPTTSEAPKKEKKKKHVEPDEVEEDEDEVEEAPKKEKKKKKKKKNKSSEE